MRRNQRRGFITVRLSLPVILVALAVVGLVGSQLITIMAVLAVPDMVLLAMHLNTTYFTPFEAFTAVLVILVSLVAVASGAITLVERSLRLP